MKSTTRIRLLYLLFVVLLVVSADRGNLRPIYGLMALIPGTDKVGHIILVAGLAWAASGLLGWRCIRGAVPWGAALVGVLMTAEEISQLWFPTRTFDLLDMAANLTGATLAGCLVLRMRVPAVRCKVLVQE